MLIIPPTKRKPRSRPVPAAAPVPPPPPPPEPAVVVSSSYGPLGLGGYATLTFDRRVTLEPGAAPDDAVTFDGAAAVAVSEQDDVTLYFELAAAVSAGAPWDVNRQPAWVRTAVAWPQAGSF